MLEIDKITGFLVDRQLTGIKNKRQEIHKAGRLRTTTKSRATMERNHANPIQIKGFGHELKVKHQNLCLYKIIIPDNLSNNCACTAY